MLFLLKLVDDYELRMGILECVVRASGEQHARQIAYEEAKHDRDREEWLDPAKSTCEVLDPNGKPEVIMAYIPFP